MPIDNLPGVLTTTTRDAERDRWLRDYLFHNPADSTAPGTQPYIQASTMADAVMPVYSDLAKLAQAQNPHEVSGAQLELEASPLIGKKLAAVGASGAVTISASVGGAQIFRGDEVVINDVRYQCTATALYQDGDRVPVAGIDTGPKTNQRAGTPGKWSSPRPGCATNCTVAAQIDGNGLTGGHDAETDDQYRTRWLMAQANPAGGGNDAQVQALAEDQEKHGVAVQKAFTFPSIFGPGSNSVAIVMVGDSLGSSRIPTASQLATVMSYLTSQLPPDGYFGARTLPSNVDVTFRIAWDRNAAGWIDLNPWPTYSSIGTDITNRAIIVSAATNALSFTLASRDGTYSGLTPPVPGKRIAFYDNANATFVRKTILTVTGTGPWAITCDGSNLASDTAYVPIVNQRVSPWSDNLKRSKLDTAPHVVTGVLEYFASLGVGEQLATSYLFDPAGRQRRSPIATPSTWPNVLTASDLTTAARVDGVVADVSPVEPTLPYYTPYGSPGTLVYLLQLRHMTFLPM